MLKLSKILYIVLIIMFLLLPNFVQAVDVNMNLNNNVVSNNNVSDATANQNTNTNTDSTSTIPGSYNPSSTVTTLNSLPEANLGLSNILSIILIVIGVLLILLAIAIIIRLKH